MYRRINSKSLSMVTASSSWLRLLCDCVMINHWGRYSSETDSQWVQKNFWLCKQEKCHGVPVLKNSRDIFSSSWRTVKRHPWCRLDAIHVYFLQLVQPAYIAILIEVISPSSFLLFCWNFALLTLCTKSCCLTSASKMSDQTNTVRLANIVSCLN